MVAPSASAAPADTDRVAGTDRYGTAADAATTAFPGGSDTVILATGERFPDALAANGLAGHHDAPILLTQINSLPPETEAALDTLGATDVIIVGGTAAVSQDVEDALVADGLNVTRSEGVDRFDTAEAAAADIGTAPDIDAGAEGGNAGPLATVILAYGFNFPDAVASSPLAHGEDVPVLLTDSDTLSADAASAMDTVGAEQVIIVGGTDVVSQSIEDGLEDDGMNVVRLAGVNRFSTATDIADFITTELGFSNETIHLATGLKFPDALAGGPLASVNNGPIVLTSSLPAETEAYISDNAAENDLIIALGGTAVIDEATLDAAAEASDEGVTGRSGVVTAVNTGTDTYTFTDSSTNEQVTVTYDSTNDVFTIDGSPSSQAAFESAITVGDEIRFVDDASTTSTADADEHHLTNRSGASYTQGTIGNIDTGADAFVIIDPVSGVTLSDTKNYAGSIYVVDGTVSTLATFEGALNEGDTVQIETDAASNKTFRLSNQTVSGSVSAVDTGNDLVRIGNLGDDPLTNQDADYDYVAGAATNSYFVGGSAATLAQFEAALTVGDQLDYTRSGNTQTFRLTNVAPPQQSGTLTNVFDTGVDTATLANGAKDISIDYSGASQFRLNGAVVTEAEVEAAMTAGDSVTYTPDNPDTTGTDEEVLSVTNATLSGALTDIDTATDTYDVANSAGNLLYDDLDYTAAVFGGSDRYFVNGSEVTLAVFEQYLTKAAADTSPDESIEVVDNNTAAGASISTDHRLTTDETLP